MSADPTPPTGGTTGNDDGNNGNRDDGGNGGNGDGGARPAGRRPVLPFGDRWARISGIATIIGLALTVVFGVPALMHSDTSNAATATTTATAAPTSGPSETTPTTTSSAPPPPTTDPPPPTTNSISTQTIWFPPPPTTEPPPPPTTTDPPPPTTTTPQESVPRPWSWASNRKVTPWNEGLGIDIWQQGEWTDGGTTPDIGFGPSRLNPIGLSLAVMGFDEPAYRDCRARTDYTANPVSWERIRPGSYLCLRLDRSAQVGFMRVDYKRAEGSNGDVRAHEDIVVSGMVWQPGA